MRSYFLVVALIAAFALTAAAQQEQTQKPPEKTKKTTTAAKTTQQPPPKTEEPLKPPEMKEQEHPAMPTTDESATAGDIMKLKWDMAEVPPVQTHHQVTVQGKTLHYTATAGRLPIKDPTGKIEAEMFFIAYTLDGADPAKRPVTFAFNGGPGSASLWIHMGALGPRKVELEKEGWEPAAPYRLMDNAYTPLPATDLVLVDAIGTGFSRAQDITTAKKFWGVKGDAEAFGEFIRMYISRNERWSSPLYLLGESYGTTRSAAVSGYLADRGIQFTGIMLLSTILDFQTVEITRKNDLACVLTLPTYTMIAAYHKKLAPELLQDMAKTRQEVEAWTWSTYWPALAKGDALTTEERQSIIAGLAKYTGLKPEIIDWANLRIDVGEFTHYLLADQKLRVGRLDGRFVGPDPDGFMDTDNYDPSNAMINAPITSVFNDYVRRELEYRTDMPYYTSAGQLSGTGFSFWRQWDWGSAVQGFPDTAIALREAMAKNPHLKVMVMEGYYDLATPYAAANYSFNHMDLSPEYHKNISFATYDSGHMVYLRESAIDKFQKDVENFIDTTEPK